MGKKNRLDKIRQASKETTIPEAELEKLSDESVEKIDEMTADDALLGGTQEAPSEVSDDESGQIDSVTGAAELPVESNVSGPGETLAAVEGQGASGESSEAAQPNPAPQAGTQVLGQPSKEVEIQYQGVPSEVPKVVVPKKRVSHWARSKPILNEDLGPDSIIGYDPTTGEPVKLKDQ